MDILAPSAFPHLRRAFHRRMMTTVVVTVLGAAALSGCTAIDKTVASDLQQSVQQVATLSSSDTTSALAELDALQQKLDDALAAGDVSDERAASIQEGVDLVRADLDAVAAEEAAAQAAATAAAEAAAEAAAAATAAEEAAAAEAQAAADAAAKTAEDAAAKEAKDAEEKADKAEKNNKSDEDD